MHNIETYELSFYFQIITFYTFDFVPRDNVLVFKIEIAHLYKSVNIIRYCEL